MEPVPETERMEEFRASPLPTLRLQDSSLYDNIAKDRDTPVRPTNLRRSTDPVPSSPLSPGWSSPMTYRPRNTSPFARGHMRSKSSTSALAPQMSRAQSMPGVNGAGHLLMSPYQRSASPSGSPSRVRTPRKPADEVFPTLPNRRSIELNDAFSPMSLSSEESTPKGLERSNSPTLGLNSPSNFRIRRPSSPLRQVSGGTTPTTPSSIASSSSSLASSPSYQTSRFNDVFLGAYNYPGSFTSSSVPSTPTSARSRSPSISSLETIPDSPDAEEAALEAERIAQLKADADAADGAEAKTKSLEGSTSRGRALGVAFGPRDKRKRWSVCGAERRGDLNLDTIWED
ncbi:hypothetical protein BP5796_07411 [Coleophoma crateriformis]|uniref:Basic proline-rich protein n=1 Tax=Coleophoma crateriformis TaxID=565419 RepID=A0A3D8RIU5_9HELO|nr:hypothetical protein BP5796_07411 [Coleophoma crateriformis]